VVKERSSLVPTSMGRVLSAFLVRHFSTWVDYQFTADMEESLDDISDGTKNEHTFLVSFWEQLRLSLADAETISTQQVATDSSSMAMHKSERASWLLGST
jgi:DNA topoisomerase I